MIKRNMAIAAIGFQFISYNVVFCSEKQFLLGQFHHLNLDTRIE